MSANEIMHELVILMNEVGMYIDLEFLYQKNSSKEETEEVINEMLE